MEIEGRNVLVLGGAGMVGVAVCRELLAHSPARLVVAARRASKAKRAVDQLIEAHPDTGTRIFPAAGDVFLRREWQDPSGDARAKVLGDQDKRRGLIADFLGPLTDEVVEDSLLAGLILGAVPEPDGPPADIVIDCMNTATAVSYQDIYTSAAHLASLAEADSADTDWPVEVETVLAALAVPQLVRHIQLLYEAMRCAGTTAYVKVGTTGSGGMGFNIPYTHGEERPSRLLLSKAALAGAQSLLTFLMARTPDGPPMVREIKPAALIAWHRIGYGPIVRRGKGVRLYDCPLDRAVAADDPANLAPDGDFGLDTGEDLEGVYIDTGENGVFTADEFKTITTLGQMQMVTPEDVARQVVGELLGGTTGRDVIGALDGAVTGPSYRAGFLRAAALDRLRRLEDRHGAAVAFEILGPPRVSKLLYEAHLLTTVVGGIEDVLSGAPGDLADALADRVGRDAALRRRILSIGIPILLPDGRRLLRGPVVKSIDAHHGWVDLTAENMQKWQTRLGAVRGAVEGDLAGDTSSRAQRVFSTGRRWRAAEGGFDVGEVVGWILNNEDAGERTKD